MEKRLNKFISESGFCSRRKADAFISSGLVLVNGEVAEVGTKVSPADEVFVDGVRISSKEEFVYLAFHKPVGVTSTTDLKDPTNIIDYIGYEERIFPIGRLDKPSEGLIFLTSDGDLVNKILRAGNNHEKEYIVTVNRPITEDFVEKMSEGVEILDTVTLPCKVEKLNEFQFKITLIQGLNRQIRRMCAKLDYEVKRLVRTRIMIVTLEGIKPGEWRYLTEEEMKEINALVTDSIKTEEASR